MVSKKKNEKYRLTIHGVVEEINNDNEAVYEKSQDLEEKKVSSFCPRCGWEIARVENYCSNCGEKIKKENDDSKKINKLPRKNIQTPKISDNLKAAGILVLISASLCFFIGLFSVNHYQSALMYSYWSIPSNDATSWLILSVFSYFSLILGIVTGILIFIRKLFFIVISGQIILIIISFCTLFHGTLAFALAGIPILFMTAISIVFTCISRNEFIQRIESKKETISNKPDREIYCSLCKRTVPADAKLCPYCGEKFDNSDVNICPLCGVEYTSDNKFCLECETKFIQQSKKENFNEYKTKFLKAAGYLTIISALICWAIGLFSIPTITRSYGPPVSSLCMFAVLFSFFALGLGLTAGILMYLKKLFYLTIIGLIILICGSIFSNFISDHTFLLLGLPVLIMTSISLVFTVLAKTEFTS